MKILMVCTNPKHVFMNVGAKTRMDKLASLFSSSNDLVFLQPLPPERQVCARSDGGGIAKRAYHFKQWSSIRGMSLAIFTDWNMGFLLKLREVVKRENIDLICISYPYGIVSADFIYPHIPMVYDAHDVESDTAEIAFEQIQTVLTAVKLPVIRSLIRWLLKQYKYYAEKLSCRRAIHIVAISELDRQRLIGKHNIDGDKITAIPPWVDIDNIKKSQLESRRGDEKVVVVFHGAYSRVNQQAFDLIANYIAPEVGKRSEKVKFLVAGSNFPKFEQGCVKSIGFVEDLSTFLEHADIAIVPLLEGSGIKTRMFDYMAVGLPIITTKKGIEGIEAENGKHALIFDTVNQDFVNAILDLASDSKKREMIGRNALELAKTRYSKESMQAKVDEMLTKIKNLNRKKTC